MLAMFASCNRESEINSAGALHIVPIAGEDTMLLGAYGIAPSNDEIAQSIEASIRIAAFPEEYSALDVYDINLDEDEEEEQIVVFKRDQALDDRIRLFFADYDPDYNEMRFVWEGVTQASNSGAFTIEFMDITGDHSIEIACFGVSAEGQHTLDIFKRSTNQLLRNINYLSIGQLQSNGGQEIEQAERERLYNLGLNGRPFSVVSYQRHERQPDVEGLQVVLTRQIYQWQETDGAFVEHETQQITENDLRAEQLNDLRNATKETFEQFLSGRWRAQIDGGGDEREGAIIFFDSLQRSIDLLRGTFQEIYNWNSSRLLYLRDGPILLINAANSVLPNVRMNVTVSSVDGGVRISIRETDQWDGVYFPLDTSESIPRRSVAFASSISAQGLYTNENGLEFYFDGSNVAISDSDRQLRGSYVFYRIDQEVLEITLFDDNGLMIDTRVYQATYEEREINERVIRALYLRPAAIRVDGLVLSNKPNISLEQIIEKSDQ